MHVALISGTSRGLGEALARQLRANGAFLVCLARSFTTEQERWAKAGAAQLLPTSLDRLEPAGAAELLAQLPTSSSALVYISNAATIQPLGAAGGPTRDALVSALQTNVVGSLVLAEAVLAYALKRDLPLSIINVSSGAAHRAIAGWSIYCASKAATDMYFAAVALDHPQVSVHRVDPGVINTNMQAELRSSEPFPLQPQFQALHADGELLDVDVAAARVLRQTIGTRWPAVDEPTNEPTNTESGRA